MSTVAEEATRVSPDTAGERPVRERLQKASIDASTHNEDAEGASTSTAAATPPKNTATSDKIASDSNAFDTAVTTSDAAKDDTATAPTTTVTRGRAQRKRSFDEAEGADQKSSEHESRQGRKRSRDSTLDQDEASAGNASGGTSGEITRSDSDVEVTTATDGGLQSEPKTTADTPPTDEIVANGNATSPKTKRTRVGEKKEDISVVRGQDTDANDVVNGTTESTATKADDKTAPKSDNAAKEDAPTSSKTSEQKTSTSAFASSGFGAFASSSASGFGTVSDGKKLSSFASPGAETKPAQPAKPNVSIFGGALGQSSAFGGDAKPAFGGSKAGFGAAFGGGAGGFKSAFGGITGAKLSTFASGATLGGAKKPVRTLGAPADVQDEASEGEGGDEDGAKLKSPKDDNEEKQDERFFHKDLETGEENERTEYTCRAKLYNFVHSNPGDETSKKEWKERGLGTLRLNVENSKPAAVEEPDPEAGGVVATKAGGSGVRARLVMRAEGSHRVILNTPIQKQLQFGTVTGDAPQNGYAYFMGSIDGKPKLELLQLKMRQQFAGELYDHIAELKRGM